MGILCEKTDQIRLYCVKSHWVERGGQQKEWGQIFIVDILDFLKGTLGTLLPTLRCKKYDEVGTTLGTLLPTLQKVLDEVAEIK